jgi:NDP-sugar pyrophosphorylase family protein
VTATLVMAGGRGDRLRASGGTVPKPLVPIGRVPLLERNLLTLFSRGFRDITMAVPSHTPEIAEFVHRRCQALADAFESRLRVFQESTPLGNIGAAAEIEVSDSELLVIYADNLTSLDLNSLVDHHRSSRAELTTAVHRERFRIPYGEIEMENGMVAAYREKPEHEILVSSGVFVLSSGAISLLPRGRRTEVSWLVNRLLAERLVVAAYPHEALWIDVNDAAAVSRAEQLVAAHADAFQLPELTALSESRGS